MRRLIVMGICSGAALVARADVALVQDGKTVATVVVRADDAPAEFAAGQLQYWTREITGASLPVVTDAADVPPPRVFVGRALAEAAFPDDAAWLGASQGFAVRERDGDLYVFGGMGVGALFGCYDMLEQATDLIWPCREAGFDRIFTPTKDLIVRKTGYREKPTIARRTFMHDHDARDFYHFLRNRAYASYLDCPLKTVGIEMDGSECHNTLKYLPWERYGKTHPEFYAEQNGVRKRQTGGFDGNACWSSMEGAAEYAKNFVRERIDGGIPCFQYGIGAEDNNLVCTCAKCLAPLALPDGRVLKVEDDEELFRSTQFLLWISRIAEEIDRLRPGTRIETIAYMYASRPPAIALPKNVAVQYAPIFKNMKQDYFGGTNKKAKLYLDQWAERCDELSFFEYWGDGAAFPRPITKILAVDIPYMAARKTTCVNSEWGHRGDAPFVSAMEFWVTCRLLWNASRPLEDCREEYLRKAYRAGAADMRVFYDTLRAAWYADSSPSYYYDNAVGLTGYYFLGDEKLGLTCYTALSNAYAKADHPVSKALVGKIKEIMERNLAQARKTFVKGGRSTIPRVKGESIRAIEGAEWGEALVLRADRELLPMFKLVKSLTAPVEARLAHDGRNLYVKYHAGYDPAVFQAKAETAKTLWENEHWGLFLQTSRSDPAVPYYLLGVDPTGRRVTNAGYDLCENPPEWTVEVRRTADSWDAVCVIPFAAFNITRAFSPRIQFLHQAQKALDKSEWASWKGLGVHNVSAFIACALEGME